MARIGDLQVVICREWDGGLVAAVRMVGAAPMPGDRRRLGGAALGERGRESIPKGKLALVWLGSILEEATPVEKARFLAELPLPARLLWRLTGDRVYAGYRDRLRRG